ncbi:hypothetical protein KPL70_012844 [Citrus sinensis]|nr:hypothetical protein KPL70_012844 [Citrus sinensis]
MLKRQTSVGNNSSQFQTTVRIAGDGRCLFRSVIHGAWLRAGRQSPSDSLQRELADELRAKVADEFLLRRAETEWFVEGDFDAYVRQMRQPHSWGGEPELLMSSHVLKMPITVYMRDKTSGSLKNLSEYGQEYGKENPIRVLYHGYGHYDLLRGHDATTQSRL